MRQLLLLSGGVVRSLLPQLERFITAAAEASNGRFTADDVTRLILDGSFIPWIEFDGTVVGLLLCRFVHFPQLTALEIFVALGDDRSGWLDYLPAIEGWARAQNCAQVIAIARLGWERVLRSAGYVRTHVQLEKPLL